MIAYFPEIYEDETVYSWFGRYYAHSGYPCYINALEDILVSRTSSVNMEFMGHLNQEAKAVISVICPMEELIVEHTMFPQYARFTEKGRRTEAFQKFIDDEERICNLLPYSQTSEKRFLNYCPICAKEDREKYGETYFHRSHILRGIRICAKHRCRLIATEIEISSKKSARLFVADDVIPYESDADYIEPEWADDKVEAAFAEYLTKVFHTKFQEDNEVGIGAFLCSKLEGTKYFSTSGQRKHVSKFYEDFTEFFKGRYPQGITKLQQIKKILNERGTNFLCVCQIAFFLGISVEELCNPKLPKMSQAEIFSAEVERLHKEGMSGCQIAKMLNSDRNSVSKALKKREKAVYDYSERKAVQRVDWDAMDQEMLPLVKKKAEEIYSGCGDKPNRVTKYSVSQAMGWAYSRFNHLPLCEAAVCAYHEEIEHYWARKCIWGYKKLEEMGEIVTSFSCLRDVVHIGKDNLKSSFPYLTEYTDAETVKTIMALVD